MVTKMRELNRSGVLTKLEALDTKYLQKIFVGGPRNRDIELSEVNIIICQSKSLPSVSDVDSVAPGMPAAVD